MKTDFLLTSSIIDGCITRSGRALQSLLESPPEHLARSLGSLTWPLFQIAAHTNEN